MSDFVFCHLHQRAMISIAGKNCADFLQNLISNDIHKIRHNKIIYATLLTPQGKFLFDFFIHSDGTDGFFLDAEKARLDMAIKKLALYRMRAQIDFDRHDDLKIWAIWDRDKKSPGNLSENFSGNFSGKNSFRDPRHPLLGWRMIARRPPKNMTQMSMDDYTSHRIALGICEAGIELTPNRFPLECNLDRLNAIDFNKGCYIGQEVTSRMMRRAHGGRKRMALVKADHDLPPPEAAITDDGKNAGFLLSAHGNMGLAIIRRDRLTSGSTQINAMPVRLDFML